MNFALVFLLISCVLSETHATFRVIGGEIINIRYSPHSVAILKCNRYICGGCLISDTSVVTPAHCVKDELPFHFTVLAGVTHLYREEGKRSLVQEIHVHPQYDREKRIMDIAVVKVKTPFQETDEIKAIKFCEELLVPNLSMQVSGWGCADLNNQTSHSPLLQTKHVQIVESRWSLKHYKKKAHAELADVVILAGISGEDFCYGDSGAGAVRKGRLCGVLQHVVGDKNPAAIFTDVTSPKVLDFIKSKM